MKSSGSGPVGFWRCISSCSCTTRGSDAKGACLARQDVGLFVAFMKERYTLDSTGGFALGKNSRVDESVCSFKFFVMGMPCDVEQPFHQVQSNAMQRFKSIQIQTH